MPSRVTEITEDNQFVDACDITIERVREGLKVEFKSATFAPMFRHAETSNVQTIWAQNDDVAPQRRFNINAETNRIAVNHGATIDAWGSELQVNNGRWNMSMFRHVDLANGATVYLRHGATTKDIALAWAREVKRILPLMFAELNQRWAIKVKIRISMMEG